METFGLTEVEIEQKQKNEMYYEEKSPIRQNKRSRIISMNSSKKKTEKLPVIDLKKSAEKSVMKIRSQSTNTMPVNVKKIDGLKQILEENKTVLRPPKKDYPSQKSFLQIFQNKISNEYDKLYNTGDYGQIMSKIKGIEKKKVMMEQIERQQVFLQKEMGLYNMLGNEQRGKEKQLDALNRQIQCIDVQLEKPVDLDEMEEKMQLYQELCSTYSQTIYEQETLENMKNHRDSVVQFMKNQCSKLMNRQRQLDETYTYMFLNNNDENNKIQIINEEMSALKVEVVNNAPTQLEEHLDDQLSQFENVKAMEEVFKHEEKQRLEREKEKKRIKMIQDKKIKQEQEQAQNDILVELKVVEKQLNNEAKRFEDLRKVTQVRGVETLVKHKGFLNQGKEGLDTISQEIKEKIQNTQAAITQLEEKRKQLLYGVDKEPTGTSSDNDSRQIQIEQMEVQFKQMSGNYRESSGITSKKRESIDSMCLLVSRILYQLQPKQEKIKNVEVKRENLQEMINVSSLMLERINGLLQKNQGDYVKVESVNTDSINDIPPMYLGLSNKRKNTKDAFDTNKSFNDKQDANEDQDILNVADLRSSIKKIDQERRMEIAANDQKEKSKQNQK